MTNWSSQPFLNSVCMRFRNTDWPIRLSPYFFNVILLVLIFKLFLTSYIFVTSIFTHNLNIKQRKRDGIFITKDDNFLEISYHE